MKKILLLLLVLSLCLCGCGAKEATLSHTYEDLTIHIPTDFTDLTGEEFAAGLNFVFGRDPIAINGLPEEKATFEAYGLQLTLEDYGKFLMLSNNITSELAKKDGIYTFNYESSDMTYVVTLHETDTAFWTVQAYCPTADYSKVKTAMWDILSSVTV